MIVVLKPQTTEEKRDHLIAWLKSQGVDIHLSVGTDYTIIGLVGNTAGIDVELLESLEMVMAVRRVGEPFKQCNRMFHPADTVIEVGGVKLGGGNFCMIAGPCSVETEEQILEVARAIQASGAQVLRGGAFKPRTSPYTFQGLGAEGLSLLMEAGRKAGLPVVSEVTDAANLPLFEDVDMVQIGARNMQNFALLREVAAFGKPVLLKRGMGATIEELLQSAEYLLRYGNGNVVLCERGIRTFAGQMRATLDVGAVPALKQATHLPVIVDPSHAAGRSDYVTPLALAAVAAGADGLMVEVHNDPASALSDGAQALDLAGFAALAEKVQRLLSALR